MWRQGEDLTRLAVRDTISTGLAYEPLIPGLVSSFEERDAARYNLYNWTDWRALEHSERALCVAYYRMSHLVELHRNDAINTETVKRHKAAERKGGRRR